MHEVLVNRFGGLSLPRKSVVRLTDRPDMTLDVYRGRKTTTQHQQQSIKHVSFCQPTRELPGQTLLMTSPRYLLYGCVLAEFVSKWHGHAYVALNLVEQDVRLLVKDKAGRTGMSESSMQTILGDLSLSRNKM